MNTTDMLTNLDPNLVRIAAAALVVGLVMAAARGFLGKLNGIALIAAMAWIVHTNTWHLLYAAMAYGAISSFLLLGSTRRARA
jgi:hypothetical protein